ncbi:uncharacterized protein [Drosophila virilis]|uniref:Uncharacterized protein n=1 Tax=Drosophila virilis TaxID=7244 RepID=B4M630_DROVI|nr:uncharacterized protein LOC6632305 [Drosophila virilis]EDW59106.1 uncharacterized protein Dvir_GJ10691 [Drosophila virilis]
MSNAIKLLLLITAQALLSQRGVQAKRFFGAGQRIDGDQLLLKDVQHSRPASISEPPNVSFKYNIVEPITYIEIVSNQNIEAEVKFSYVDTLVVGIVRLVTNDGSTLEADIETASETPRPNLPAAFDVLITIYGYNETFLNVNPALLINRDSMYEGEMTPYDFDYENISEPYDNDKPQTVMMDDEDDEPSTDATTYGPDFELKDKIIEIGQRQKGDDLIYETYQTSPDVSKEQTNHTVIFYYIDSDFITYVKFVIFDHFADKIATAEDYTAPVAEYSHYSPTTLKATITDFNISSLFVQMFVYGYRGVDAPPPSYKPFLKGKSQIIDEKPSLTPLQRIQLLLLTGRSTTPSDLEQDETDDSEEDDAWRQIKPEDMVPDHVPDPSITNAVLEQQRAVPQRLYAMLGLMLFAVA